MYTGTVIDDLIKTVQRAEVDAKQIAAPKSRQSAMFELQVFMHKMQQTQRVRVGAA
jgi:hypothetical protein